MATYSGLCILVRLQAFRSFPLSLTQVLRDQRVFKVGVGCYEDGKRLTRDHGLSLSCTLDLRYLALRQKYSFLGFFEQTLLVLSVLLVVERLFVDFQGHQSE